MEEFKKKKDCFQTSLDVNAHQVLVLGFERVSLNLIQEV